MRLADLRVVFCVYMCSAVAANHYQRSKQPAPARLEADAPNGHVHALKGRHHSRHPNLDRVLTKIDSLQAKKAATSGYSRIRHSIWGRTTTTTTTTTTENPFEGDDYEDEEEKSDDYDMWEDDSDDFTDGNEDNINDDADDYENDGSSSSIDNWQDEEPTNSHSSPPVSTITQYKWDTLGTRSKVEETRQQHLHLRHNNDQQALYAAVEHFKMVQKRGQCRTPIAKVIPVQSVHPDPRKTYTPHCTILHRCSEDTGCCSDLVTKCAPKKQVAVHLYFYVQTLGMSRTKVERLSFHNHTECACLEKNQIAPVTFKDAAEELPQGLPLKSASLVQDYYQYYLRNCKCPQHFVARLGNDTRSCVCDCELYNSACISIKKGHEHLGYNDRMCIRENRCNVPICEYGAFLRLNGTCPKKHHKLEFYRRLMTIN